ncbi:MAG: hypothetical protein M4579_004139 [Chaenotheca gracillima]|nr:MAG: hypothetical protein M4579_004139 [Chaenotheca gracillima]
MDTDFIGFQGSSEESEALIPTMEEDPSLSVEQGAPPYFPWMDEMNEIEAETETARNSKEMNMLEAEVASLSRMDETDESVEATEEVSMEGDDETAEMETGAPALSWADETIEWVEKIERILSSFTSSEEMVELDTSQPTLSGANGMSEFEEDTEERSSPSPDTGELEEDTEQRSFSSTDDIEETERILSSLTGSEEMVEPDTTRPTLSGADGMGELEDDTEERYSSSTDDMETTELEDDTEERFFSSPDDTDTRELEDDMGGRAFSSTDDTDKSELEKETEERSSSSTDDADTSSIETPAISVISTDISTTPASEIEADTSSCLIMTMAKKTMDCTPSPTGETSGPSQENEGFYMSSRERKNKAIIEKKVRRYRNWRAHNYIPMRADSSSAHYNAPPEPSMEEDSSARIASKAPLLQMEARTESPPLSVSSSSSCAAKARQQAMQLTDADACEGASSTRENLIYFAYLGVMTATVGLFSFPKTLPLLKALLH